MQKLLMKSLSNIINSGIYLLICVVNQFTLFTLFY